MKLRFYLKSGVSFDIECEEYKFGRDAISVELDSYSIKGMKNEKLVYANLHDISAIIRKEEEP